MEARYNVSSPAKQSIVNQIPSSTFPETFKDFFSMTNEDEDHVELISNILEDKVIPRYNVRGRNRSSSAKYSNSTSLLPSTSVAVRSNSLRINRNSSNALARSPVGTFMPDFYNDQIDMNDGHNNVNNFNDNPALTQLTFDEINANNNIANFNAYCDDGKSMKLTRKYSIDASINLNPPSTHTGLQKSFEGFENCNYGSENRSASGFDNSTNDELKLKSTGSSYCLMRHNRSVNQLRERGSSGATSSTYNFSINCDNTMQNKSTESTMLTSTTALSNRKQAELNQQKSPIPNRRRASSITLARTIPNFGSPQPTSPIYSLNEIYRYMKCDDPKHKWTQQVKEQQTSHTTSSRYENRDKYSHVKPSNFSNQKATTETTNVSVKKAVEPKKPQRARTASMPGENRKPRLADTRRSAIHCADADIEYYRLRSFSITSHGICNLGDSMRSRRSRSINSVASSNSGRDRNNSTGSQHMEEIKELDNLKNECKSVPYKIAMLGDSTVGKSSLTYQFTTSEYICAYDLSLDDDYGQKTVSVLVNNQETELEIIDHPACEMSVEAFCSTYSIDLFVIVYSVVNKKTFKIAEKILLYLKENEMMLTRGVILVGNKTDLERQREVSTQAGRKLAKEIGCKFIETSSGLNHKVDELLVGIVAQVKLNPQRIRNLSEKQRNSLCVATKQKDKETETQDLFTVLRRNERNKSNKENQMKFFKDKIKGTSSTSTTSAGTDTTTVMSKESGKGNKENEFEDESDDERSSDEDSDIEKYLNLDDKIQSTTTVTKHHNESSMSTNFKRLLKSRRYATPGMTHGVNYGVINSYFNNDNNRDINNSNNNISSSSCSTPITLHPPSGSSISYQNQINTSKGDFNSSSYERNNSSPLSSSQQSTPKKSNFLSDDNDTNERCINKISNRTKMFLTSFLKFKRSLRVKRRNSNSCSDLFVI
ncbi:uncharacterized protein [Chironomus tepperi]|uniref:uncharacterized protein isoform X2 n=1 Tax=Chironomus tepperi TaxID=113505 RepID=UPI00391FA84E